MRLTFIHDHRFYNDKEKYFSSGKLSKEVMERYLVEPIDNIQIIGRELKIPSDKNNFIKTSSSNIIVNPMKFLNSNRDFILKKKKIYNFLKKNINDEDIVIIRLPSEIGYIAAEYLYKQNISYGIELVGDPWDALWYHGSLVGKIMACINSRKVKKLIRKSNNTIYVTKEYLQRLYPSKKNVFSASNVLIKEVKDNYRPYSSIHKRVGMIGSLDTKYKGIDTALQSMKLMNPNITLEIVGNGPQEKWKREIKRHNLSDRVTLKGTLKSGNEINAWFSTLDLYIQPSYTEGLPRALIEAMANGIPCLGSDAGGIPELLEKTCIHPVKDYQTLAKQMKVVLEDDKLRDKLSLQNLSTAESYLSSNIQKEREKFIKSIYREKVKYES